MAFFTNPNEFGIGPEIDAAFEANMQQGVGAFPVTPFSRLAKHHPAPRHAMVAKSNLIGLQTSESLHASHV